jgi:hypothetical protein
MDASNGHIITTLPIGNGVDGAEFNPVTGEAISSQGDGSLTIIREDGPAQFVVSQTVATKTGARTSTLDAKTNHVFLVTADRMSAPQPSPASQPPSGGAEPWRQRAQMVPDTFTIIEVGR